MITGNEKAWIGTGVGIFTSVIAYVLTQLPQDPALDTVRLTLLILSGVVGIVGSGLGVYAMTNTPPVKPDAPTASAVPMAELERQAAQAAAVPVVVPEPPAITAAAVPLA